MRRWIAACHGSFIILYFHSWVICSCVFIFLEVISIGGHFFPSGYQSEQYSQFAGSFLTNWRSNCPLHTPDPRTRMVSTYESIIGCGVQSLYQNLRKRTNIYGYVLCNWISSTDTATKGKKRCMSENRAKNSLRTLYDFFFQLQRFPANLFHPSWCFREILYFFLI